MPAEMLTQDEYRVPQRLPRATAPTQVDEPHAAARRRHACVPGQTGWNGIAHKALPACGIVAPPPASDVIAGMRCEEREAQ